MHALRFYEFFSCASKYLSDAQLTVHSSASLLFSLTSLSLFPFLFSFLLFSSSLPLSSDLFTFLVALRLTFVRQPSSCSFFRRCRIRVCGLINMSCIRAHLPAAATAVAVAATAHHRHHRRARRAAPYLKLAPRRASGLAGEREAMCTRRLHRSILSFSFILAPSRARFLSYSISLPLSLSLSYHFFLASSLLPLSAAPCGRFSSFSFSSPLFSFFSTFDHQRHVRRTNVCTSARILARDGRISLLSDVFRLPVLAVQLAVRLADRCSRIVLNVCVISVQRSWLIRP